MTLTSAEVIIELMFRTPVPFVFGAEGGCILPEGGNGGGKSGRHV